MRSVWIPSLVTICQKPDRFSAEFIECDSVIRWVKKTLKPRVDGTLAASLYRHHLSSNFNDLGSGLVIARGDSATHFCCCKLSKDAKNENTIKNR
jgi:hypothetical protein